MGARAVTDTPLQLHAVWLAEVHGEAYGLLTSPIAYRDNVDDADLLRHAFFSAIQSCFLSEDFVSPMATEPVGLDEIFAELGTAACGSATVEVEGTAVACCQLVYRGVEFVCALDYEQWPFTAVSACPPSGRHGHLARQVRRG